MPKFRIDYTRSFYGSVIIEADTESAAEDIFYDSTDLDLVGEESERGCEVDFIEEV